MILIQETNLLWIYLKFLPPLIHPIDFILPHLHPPTHMDFYKFLIVILTKNLFMISLGITCHTLFSQ